MRSLFIHTLAGVLVTGLVVLIIGCIGVGMALRAGIVPTFDQQITLNSQHSIMIHNGLSPTCAVIPNPPQHDCFAPEPARREFSVDYLTPHGVRSLIWFRLGVVETFAPGLITGAFSAIVWPAPIAM